MRWWWIGIAAGCGARVDEACADYVDAWDACARTSYPDDDAAYRAVTFADGKACEPYADMTGVEARTAEDLLRCAESAYRSGDCTSSDGFAEAAVAAASCGA